MKILLYGVPRTRSSYLQDILAQNFNINNNGEPYNLSFSSVWDKTLFKKSDFLWKNWQKDFWSVTSNLENKKDFIAKIFVAHTYNTYKNLENKKLEPTDFIDIQKVFLSYDKVYILCRNNLVNNICSWYYAIENNLFYNLKNTIPLINNNKTKKIKINYIIKDLRCFIIDNHILKYQIDNCLNSVNYEIIDYDDIPKYVETNFPNRSSMFVDANYQYDKIISNYEQLIVDIENIKNELRSHHIIGKYI